MDNDLDAITCQIKANNTKTEEILDKLQQVRDELFHQHDVALQLIRGLKNKNMKNDMLLLDIMQSYSKLKKDHYELKEKYDTLIKQNMKI